MSFGRKLPTMSRLTTIVLLVSVSIICCAQAAKRSGTPALRQMSSNQLKACLEKADFCGSDVWALSDELARRLATLHTDTLVACFGDWKICGVGEDKASGWPISDELARRGNPHDLLTRFWKEPNWEIRDGIEHVAYHFDTPEVTAFMQRVLTEHAKDGEDLYWPVNYLAKKKCDPDALKQLATSRYRNQECMQYETSVKLFGKCRYRAAIPYLVDTAVYDACLNIVDSADFSLDRL